jgi:outer membrane protein assembly factor BamE (lipoprotein component of BamABCDE complex)
MTRFVAAAMAALLMASSVWAADLPSDKLNTFKAGQTTKAQVLSSLGAPKAEDHNPDGRSVLLYDYSVPLTEKNKNISEMVVTFLFDSQDVLVRAQLYARNPNAAGGAQPSAQANPPAAPAAGPQDENLLTRLAKGFKVGSQGDSNGETAREMVPEAETVQDWSRMITIQIFHRLPNANPNTFADGMQTRWAGACKGADFETIAGAPENGYPASIRRFSCPLNSQTGKPENTFMKFVGGADAFYVVQYAYRSGLTPENTAQALDYLKSATVCDSRKADHPCPKLQPIAR